MLNVHVLQVIVRAGAPAVKFGRRAAPCGSLRPERFRGSPAGLFRPSAPPFCMWLRCFASRRARGPFQPGVGLPRRSRGSPGDLGTVKWGNAVHVHEPSGISVRKFWWRAPLGLIVVRHGRGMQSAPADDSTSQERAARANDGKALPLAWRDDTILSYLAFCYQNSTRCPYSTVPATSTISGAPHSSTCNFLARTQR